MSNRSKTQTASAKLYEGYHVSILGTKEYQTFLVGNPSPSITLHSYSSLSNLHKTFHGALSFSSSHQTKPTTTTLQSTPKTIHNGP